MWDVVQSVCKEIRNPPNSVARHFAPGGSVQQGTDRSVILFSRGPSGTGTACCVSKGPAFCPRSASCAWCVYQSNPVRLRTAGAVRPTVCQVATVLSGLISFFNGCAMGKAIIAGLSPRAPEFDPRLVNVVFVVDRVALGQVFLPVFRFSPVTILAPFLHTNLYLHVAVIRRTNGWSLGTCQQQYYFGNQGSQDGRCLRPFRA